jgi:hypothetical protein
LKGLPCDFKRATKKKKKFIPFLNQAAQEKILKVGSALRSQYNFGEGRIKSSTRGKLVSVSEFRHSR